MLGRRRLAVQQVEEVGGNRVVVGVGLDASPAMAEVIPVAEHRAEAGDQTVADLDRGSRVLAGTLREHGAEDGAPRAQHVHRVSARRDQFEGVLDDGRQGSQTTQPRLVLAQFGGRRQFPVDEQPRDLLERLCAASSWMS